MGYVTEILSNDVVWLSNENRRLISIHKSPEEASCYCKNHFKVAPEIVDRRKEHQMDVG